MADEPNLQNRLWFPLSAKNQIFLNQPLKTIRGAAKSVVALVWIVGQPFLTTPYMTLATKA
jgi:hypothetical protein